MGGGSLCVTRVPDDLTGGAHAPCSTAPGCAGARFVARYSVAVTWLVTLASRAPGILGVTVTGTARQESARTGARS
jgi:hypothetical protein